MAVWSGWGKAEPDELIEGQAMYSLGAIVRTFVEDVERTSVEGQATTVSLSRIEKRT